MEFIEILNYWRIIYRFSIINKRCKKLKILTITSGAAGMKRQVEAVAIALIRNSHRNFTSEVIKCTWKDSIVSNVKLYGLLFVYRYLQKNMAFLFGFLPKLSVTWILENSQETLKADIIISCGRKAAMASRLYKYFQSPKSKLIHIEDPRKGYSDFDLLFLPAHDKPIKVNSTKPKVVKVYGAFSPFVDYLLQQKPEHKKILAMKSPKRCMLIGGSGKGLNMNNAWVDSIVSLMNQRQIQFGGNWAITYSRRTHKNICNRFYNQIQSYPNLINKIWIWSGKGLNPYSTMLNHSDEIIVTIDSTSMLLQASATKAKLSLLDMNGERKKITRLTKRLVLSGRASWFYSANKGNEKSTHNYSNYKVWDSTLFACYEIYKLLGLSIKDNQNNIINK